MSADLRAIAAISTCFCALLSSTYPLFAGLRAGFYLPDVTVFF